MLKVWASVGILAVMAFGCGDDGSGGDETGGAASTDPPAGDETSDPAPSDSVDALADVPLTISVTSDAFIAGQPIPDEYSLAGGNVSPPLTWSDLPEGTVEVALLVDDPDAPRDEPFVHWLVAGLDPEGEIHEGGLPTPAVEGTTDFGEIGWGGPAPPSGVHRYQFTVLALGEASGLEPGFTRAELEAVAAEAALARGVLTATYAAA